MFSKTLGALTGLCLLLASSLASAQPKVLYVTFEPGRWHDYSDQLQGVQRLAKDAGWSLRVATGSAEETLAFLAAGDYSAGQDAVIYNFCYAASENLAAMTNLIRQTEELGVPALLVHCAMHSWWATFKKGVPIPGNIEGQARADKKVLAQWQASYPGRALPAWGDFTGIASTKHGPKKPIELRAVMEHPITAKLPAGYSTGKTELYNNVYLAGDPQPLIMGRQGNEEAIVMWQARRGRGQIIGLTLGHADEEWGDPVFLQLLRASVEYLAKMPDQGPARVE